MLKGGAGMKELIKVLKKDFQDEDYRCAYDEEFSNERIATQIKVIREQRKMTQAQLAEKAAMKQSRISALENVHYSAWSISTLRRLARALGVRLSFRFESWGQLLTEIENFGRENLEEPAFDEDPTFINGKVGLEQKVKSEHISKPFEDYLSGINKATSSVISMADWRSKKDKNSAASQLHTPTKGVSAGHADSSAKSLLG